MAYRLVDIDVTQSPLKLPVPDGRGGLETSSGYDGTGLLLRDGDRPLSFCLVPDSGGALTPEAVEQLAVSTGGENLLAERLRRALLDRSMGGGHPAPPTGTAPSVTVVVCTRNRPDDLERCLDSIRVAVAEFAGQVDLLVVDNAPPDEATREVVARRPDVRYVREPVPGLDVARNKAVSEARGRWLAFVDDDVRVDRWWLQGLAAALEEHPDASALTGLVLPAQLETQAQIRFERGGGFGRGYTQRRWDGRQGPGGRLHPLGSGVFGAGCNMAFEVSVLRRVGGFDEALDTGPPLPGGGDLDIFFKVLAAGHTLVYEPRMAVFHRHRRGMDELQRQYSSWGAGFAAYLAARWQEPQERAQIRRMALWWLRYQQRNLLSAARHADVVGARMVAAELTGGVAGAVGGYRRSRERMSQRYAEVRARGKA